MQRKKLSELITPARERLGLSMHECSRRAGMSAVYWHQVERDKKIPSPQVLKKMCSTLSLDLAVASAVCEERRDFKKQTKEAAKDLASLLFRSGFDVEDCIEELREKYG